MFRCVYCGGSTAHVYACPEHIDLIELDEDRFPAPPAYAIVVLPAGARA